MGCLYIGVREGSGELYVMRVGAIRVTSSHRRQETETWNQEGFVPAKGLPWQPIQAGNHIEVNVNFPYMEEEEEIPHMPNA